MCDFYIWRTPLLRYGGHSGARRTDAGLWQGDTMVALNLKPEPAFSLSESVGHTRSHGLVKSPRHPSKISGQLEVLSPEDGIIVGQLGIKARTSSDGPLLSLKGSVNGSLQVLDDGDGVLVEQLNTGSRARSSASRKNSEGRMTHTPTKQISLNAPKVTSDICLRDAEKPLNMKQSVQTRSKDKLPPHVPGDAASDLHGSQSETEQKTSICKIMKGQPMESEINDEKPEDSVGSIEPVILSPSVNTSSPVNGTNISTKSPGSDEGETDSTADSEDEEGDSEDEDRKAPIELLGEFLHAVMNENYTLANKLCQMILIYEADNPEAKQFIPLIEAKLLIEQEQDEHESTDESSSEDSDDDSSTESDSSVSGDSSEEDSDTSEDEADDDTQEA
ncbi:glutamate-rich protein 2 isoform X2 [Erpetoichthys calabaricus]|uniref:glutamate-rich protein 2 isoform X2 n=1 Tax=Erpetoichthys calabaricus TaxID=27687 RepID=UPI002234CF71|nr:glutamate-rich protein 2 isoform X2 [Erpetoichthys calabaricus]